MLEEKQKALDQRESAKTQENPTHEQDNELEQ